jgi:hypothetical protein
MSGWQVNRGGSTTINNGRVPAAEAPPSVEAELVEEEPQEVYAVESQPEERPDLRESPTEELIEVKLRSLIPETKEDFKRGFKLLSDDERAEYGISSNPLTREDAAKQEFTYSSQSVGDWVEELLAIRPPFPPGYLIENGNQLSDRCRYEIFKRIKYASQKIPPGDPRDWRKLKKSKKQSNPKYKTHRFKYHEARVKQTREYHEWLADQPDPDVKVHQGEFVPPREVPPEDREENFSKKRSAIQKAQGDFEMFIRQYMKQKGEIALEIVEEEMLSIRQQMEERANEVLLKPEVTEPPELDEDEDL